jgi:hypothetical protein
MKNTMQNLLPQDTVILVQEIGDNAPLYKAKYILENSRNIYNASPEQNRLTIRHNRHYILYWPEIPRVKIFNKKQLTYVFDSVNPKNDKIALRVGNDIINAIQAEIPKINERKLAHQSTVKTREFLDKQSLIIWAKLRTKNITI